MGIREKGPWDKVPDISPSKKGKIEAYSKRKEVMPPPEVKKKKTKSSKMVSMGAILVLTPRVGTSSNLDDVLGPKLLCWRIPSWQRNFLWA